MDSNSVSNQQNQSNLRDRSSAPLEAATQLILKASQLWDRDPLQGGYRDDISIVAHKLIV